MTEATKEKLYESDESYDLNEPDESDEPDELNQLDMTDQVTGDVDDVFQLMHDDAESDANYGSEEENEAGLDDANESTDWDPNREGVGDTDDAKSVGYPDCQQELAQFLEDKNLAYSTQRDDYGRVELISMRYQGTTEEPGLADITSRMRDRLGYAEGRFEPDAVDHHVDTILEKITGFEYHNDSMHSRYDRFVADLSQHRANTLRSPEQVENDLAKMTEFQDQLQEAYDELRTDIRNELLHGAAAAQHSFASYQNKLNDAAEYAAQSRAQDYYDILGVDANSGTSDIRQARRDAAPDYHGDLHPYPEYHTYMIGVNEANRILSDPAEKEKYDALLRQNAQAHEEARQAGNNGPTGEPSSEYEATTGDPSDLAEMEKYDALLRQDSQAHEEARQAGNNGPTGEPSSEYNAINGDPNEDEAEGWGPEKMANWHRENEQRELNWLELLLLLMAQMMTNAIEKAGGPSADGLNYAIANMPTKYGPDSQTQHRDSIANLGQIEENIAAHYAVNDDVQAEALRDLTKRAGEHLTDYGLFDDRGNSVRSAQEPYYEIIDYDDPDKNTKCEYSPIRGLEWDNPDHTIDDTMAQTMMSIDDESLANRQSISNMLKERVDWIQNNDRYIDFSRSNVIGAEELLDQYNNNQVNRELREQAIEPVLLWNAENNLGAMVSFLDKSVERQRELSQEEIKLVSDTIRHCDYMINATGSFKEKR